MATITRWRKYPICLLGFVQGQVRFESIGEGDFYPASMANAFFIFRRPFTFFFKEFGITHIQKKSWFGFLIMWPLCFHVWIQFRKQKQEDDENKTWIPGTEFVIYRRAGARWEAGSGNYEWPSLYLNFSTHWD